MLTTLIILISSYLIGSIASAILVCKMMGKSDPREQGSGNPGATNVLRLHGKKAAILTLMGDALKGFVPVLIVRMAGLSELDMTAAGLGAFLGHLYPLYFQFRGGKGVATYVGLLFGAHWLFGICFAAIWLSMAALFRYSSLAALTAAVLLPLIAYSLSSALYLSLSYAFMTILLLWRHRSNIRQLIAGTEGKLGGDKS